METFVCLVCEKTFGNLRGLRQHERVMNHGYFSSEAKEREIETLEKSHKCNLCGELFYQEYNLKSHIYEIHPDPKFQPQPIANQESQIILHKVLVDLINRSEHGQKTYGTFLQSHNGRNALLDAYEEALDLCMYLRQALDEQTKKREFASSRSERE